MEIAAGIAVLANLFAGDAAVLLLAVIVTAMTTKIPILLGRPLGPFALPKNVSHYGVAGFVHEARTDLAMQFCLLAIVVDSGVGSVRKRR